MVVKVVSSRYNEDCIPSDRCGHRKIYSIHKKGIIYKLNLVGDEKYCWVSLIETSYSIESTATTLSGSLEEMISNRYNVYQFDTIQECIGFWREFLRDLYGGED